MFILCAIKVRVFVESCFIRVHTAALNDFYEIRIVSVTTLMCWVLYKMSVGSSCWAIYAICTKCWDFGRVS